jgi:hypothetical protein
MQIVEFTEKDAVDSIMLLREHEIGSSDNETINQNYISDLLARDWGFYYTVTTNLRNLKDSFVDRFSREQLPDEDRTDVKGKLDQLIARIDETPKTMGWKVRAKVGTKKTWYQQVEPR